MSTEDGNQKSVVQRKVVNMGGTLYVSIPKRFVVQHKLRAGDMLPMVISALSIKLIPYEKP